MPLQKVASASTKAIRISKGWLGTVTTSPWNTRQSERRISKVAASNAIRVMNGTGSVRNLSQSIGLAGRALRVLAREGVLHSIPYGKGYWNVRLVPSEVFSLSSRLLSAASRGIGSIDRRILIDRAVLITCKHSPALVKPLVNALLQKTIPLRYMGDAPLIPGDLTLKLKDLRAWLKVMRMQKS